MHRLAVLFCVLALPATALSAQEAPAAGRPQLELGFGGLVLSLPDYRGSDQYGARVFPIPYLTYRSERVQITREGLRARLFSMDRVTASLSGAASLPGNDENPDRAGMPQLDPTFELGPSLDLLLQDNGRLSTRLRLPVRAVVAADGLKLDDVGWVFVPHLRLDYGERRGGWDWLHLASLGAVWANEEYHDYFYEVAPQFADSALNRPAYDAVGGYSGARFTLSSQLQRERWRFGMFASYDWMRGAAFEDSPLFKTEHAVVAGLYLTYRLYARGTGQPFGAEAP